MAYSEEIIEKKEKLEKLILNFYDKIKDKIQQRY
jgi:hypothetical protein